MYIIRISILTSELEFNIMIIIHSRRKTKHVNTNSAVFYIS